MQQLTDMSSINNNNSNTLIKLIEEFQSKNNILKSLSLNNNIDYNKYIELNNSIKNLAKKITLIFKERTNIDDKRIILKLKTSFENELNIYKNTTLIIENKERDALNILANDDNNTHILVDSYNTSQQQKLLSSNTSDHLAAIQNKQESIHQIERDVVLLNDMFKDLNYLVVEQQVGIDLIENNVLDTRDKTKSGLVELNEASEYQTASRKWMCCIAVIAVIIIAIVAIVLGVVLKKD